MELSGSIAFLISAVLLMYLLVVSTYMALITIGAWLYRRRGDGSPREPTVAIIVPAHNEEAGIESTITDLLAMDYPRENYAVFVIADNCDDRTGGIAEKCGAIVSERHDDVNRGKGQALDWFLETYRAELERFDLVVFVDADMQVDRDFLREAVKRFDDPKCDVVQVRYTVNPDVGNWREAVAFASFAFVNHVRPAGRCFWGGTADLKGSGMFFRRAQIVESGWPTHSIAEDVEFGKELLLRGTRVIYEPGSVLTTRIPDSFEQIAVQQSRWESGKAVVMRKYFVRLLREFLRHPRARFLDAMLDMIVPPLSVVLLAAAIGGTLSAIFAGLHWAWFLLPVSVFAISVVTGLFQLRAPVRVWGMLAMAPAFVLWKLALLMRVKLGRKETQWRRTPRALK